MKKYYNECISFVMLVIGILLQDNFPDTVIRLGWYLIALMPVGIPVFKEAWEALRAKDFANEFTLMALAVLGAFCIGEYPEGVAVMLFYAVGEKLQEGAVDKARDSIRTLLDMRPQKVSVRRGEGWSILSPDEVQTGDVIEVKAGEHVSLDGKLHEESAFFNTATLTGESIPKEIKQGEEVLAGMIPCEQVIHLTVSRTADNSTLSRILKLVEEAAEQKAPTELFMRKIARIYTPIVMAVALLILAAPFVYSLFCPSYAYLFSEWLYRALVFLVVSCPCALVISIPLSYFAGIGTASRKGILFKGGNYLDAISRIDTVIFDKTGTLTTGNFKVGRIEGILPSEVILTYVAAAESRSTHPMAKAIQQYAAEQAVESLPVTFSKEWAGYGLEAVADGKHILAGSLRLLDKFQISYPEELRMIPETIIACAIDRSYAGYILLTDEIKPDAAPAIRQLKRMGIGHIAVLSGDKAPLVQHIAQQLDITHAHGDLLPDGKVAHLQRLKEAGRRIAFVGDGINDAPVLALSDAGIAMGGLGSDIAIDTADIVIQNDRLIQLPAAIKTGRSVRQIVWQNIIFAFAVKLIVLALGAWGLANLWEAVIADTGVALLAVCNSLRIGHIINR